MISQLANIYHKVPSNSKPLADQEGFILHMHLVADSMLCTIFSSSFSSIYHLLFSLWTKSDSQTYAELKCMRNLIKQNWIPNDTLKDIKFKLLKCLEVNAWLRVL